MTGKRMPLERGERGLLIATVLFIALVVGPFLYWRWLDTNPVIAIPAPIVIHPNAMDEYVNAASAVVNGEIVYPAPGKSYSLAEREKVLAKNAPSLAQFRRAQALPYQDIACRSFDTPIPHYAKMRQLARLLAFAGTVKSERGDYAGAVDHQLDAIEMGARSNHSSVLIGMLVGIAIESIGRIDSWGRLTHLNATQARRGAQRLEAAEATRGSYADVLQEEQWATLAGLQEIFRQPNWRKNLFRAGDFSDPRMRIRLMLLDKREAVANYTRYMAAAIAQSKQPYSARHGHSIPVPSDPICTMILPVFDKAQFKDDENRTFGALLTAGFALQAYHQEHGRYPTTLSQLVPGYLHAIPTDVFFDGKPLHYKVTGATYCLYSVGPDGKDDGGTPCKDGRRAPTGATRAKDRPLQPKSLGDIVAGINTY